MIGGNGCCFADCAVCKPVSSQQQHVWISGSHLDALHGLGGFFDELRIVYLPRLRLQLLRLLEPRLSVYTCAHRASAQRTPGATLRRHAALRAELLQQTCCLLSHQCSTAGTCCRCSSSSKALMRGSAAPVAVAAAEGKSAEAPRLWNPGPPAIPTSPIKHGNDT